MAQKFKRGDYVRYVGGKRPNGLVDQSWYRVLKVLTTGRVTISRNPIFGQSMWWAVDPSAIELV